MQNKMKVLYLDTSSKFLSLAVAKGDKLLSQMHRKLDRKHSLQLVPLIAKILKQARVPLKKIDGFCVSKGPGSFTGLRIGITVIKTLSLALGKPVVAIPSLDILAENIRKIKGLKPEDICTLVDARQNKVYACLYKRRNGKIRRKSGYLLMPFAELLKKLKGEILFLGDGISIYGEEIKKAKNIKPVFADEKFWHPKASAAVSLGLERFQKGQTEQVNSLTPLYLYAKTCQIKKVKR